MNTLGKLQVKAEAQNANRHAVVLGGSLAGLLTARILSDHFEHVTSRRFQKRLAKINEAPWLLATGEDYRYPETVGGSPSLMTRFMHRYMDQAVLLATQSVAVRKVLLKAFNMLTRPTALFHPRVLFRVLLQVLKPARRNAAQPSLTLKPATEREAL